MMRTKEEIPSPSQPSSREESEFLETKTSIETMKEKVLKRNPLKKVSAGM